MGIGIFAVIAVVLIVWLVRWDIKKDNKSKKRVDMEW